MWVLYSDCLRSEKMAKVFVAGNKPHAVRAFEIQGGVNWIKKTTGAFSLWAAVISPRSTMVQIPSGWLAILLTKHEGGSASCLVSWVRVGPTFSSWNKSFYVH